MTAFQRPAGEAFPDPSLVPLPLLSSLLSIPSPLWGEALSALVCPRVCLAHLCRVNGGAGPCTEPQMKLGAEPGRPCAPLALPAPSQGGCVHHTRPPPPSGPTPPSVTQKAAGVAWPPHVGCERPPPPMSTCGVSRLPLNQPSQRGGQGHEGSSQAPGWEGTLHVATPAASAPPGLCIRSWLRAHTPVRQPGL